MEMLGINPATGTASPVSDAGGAAPSPQMVAALAQPGTRAMNTAPGKIYENDEPSPLDPPDGASRDLMARIIAAEADRQPQVGQDAVANVIRTRAVHGGYGGNTTDGVITKPYQFEPMNTAAGRARMAAFDPQGKAYQNASQAIDNAYFGSDPTNGATHFIEPVLQQKLGRPIPGWAQGPGQFIGDHKFIGGVPQSTVAQAGLPPVVTQGDGSSMAFSGQPQAQPAPTPAAPQLPAAIIKNMQSPNKKVAEEAWRTAQPYLTPQTPAEVNGQLVDKRTGKVLGDYRNPDIDIKEQDGRYFAFDKRKGGPGVEVTPPALAQTGESDIPPAPPGTDKSIWRKKWSERKTEESMPASFEDHAKVRGEVQKLVSYRKVANSLPVYNSMVAMAGQNDRAADLNLVYGFATVMDPDSVVRGEEMTMVKAIATMPEQLRATVQSQLEGSGQLSPEVREALMRQAHSRVKSYKTLFDQDAQMYRGIAKRGRMNEEDIIPNFGDIQEFKPQKKGKGDASAPVEIDGYKIRAK
jgi:spore germination cell wall hydrolase CwlJ-like protein